MIFRDLLLGSNLKNFVLGPAHGREIRETSALYDSARTAYQRFPLASEEARIQYVRDTMFDACKRSDRFPSELLLQAITALVHELLALDSLVALPIVRSVQLLSVDEGIALRAYLWRFLRFAESWDQLSQVWRQKVIALIEGILDALPASAFADDRAEAGEVDPMSLLSVPLIDLCYEPALTIERAIRTICDHDFGGARVFDVLEARVEQNALLASGITPDRRRDASKRIIGPAEFRARSNEELVHAYLGGTPLCDFFSSPLPFAIPFAARFEHMHVVGGSGHGKTQLLQLLIYHDLLKARDDGRSLIVIDSQGDLIQTVSNLSLFSPAAEKSLADRLLIIDPNDVEYPACLNMFDWNRDRLARYSTLEREKLLNSTIELYEYLFGALLGAELTARQDVVFRYIARLMMEIPDATIQTLRELMEDGNPFRPYMARLPGSARSFFETRFFDRSFGQTRKQILTRLWAVLSNSMLERMFSHPRNKVDVYGAINSGKIVLINTAKDLLKQEGCAIFGRFFISLIAQAALERASIPSHERRPCFLYVDEAQDYFDDNVGYLLNQARKYRVGMVFAHQNLDQLTPALRSSVMASTSIKCAGGVSAKDARALAEDMRCADELILSTRKRRQHTEFACHVRNFTSQAVRVTVPLGFVESLPKLQCDEYAALIDLSRSRCAERLDVTAPASRPADVSLRIRRADDRYVMPEQDEDLPDSTAEPDTPQPQPDAERPTRTPQKRAAKAKRIPIEPAPLGRGGRQHTYLQNLLKLAAQERGYLAVIEEPVLDGAGKVDLSLTKDGRRIACEISVTTGQEHELGNVEKCLAAGYEEVLLVAADERQLKALSKFVSAQLDEETRDRVRYLTPEAVLAYLDELEVGAAPVEETVRGYKVRVTRGHIDSDEARSRRQAIAAVLARSLHPERKGQ